MIIDPGPVDGRAEERIIFLGVHAHRAENYYRMIALCIQVGPGGPYGNECRYYENSRDDIRT
jgi:hypothetical protein